MENNEAQTTSTLRRLSNELSDSIHCCRRNQVCRLMSPVPGLVYHLCVQLCSVSTATPFIYMSELDFPSREMSHLFTQNMNLKSLQLLTRVWRSTFCCFNLYNAANKPWSLLGCRSAPSGQMKLSSINQVCICKWTPVTGGKPNGFSSVTQTRRSLHRGAFLSYTERVKLQSTSNWPWRLSWFGVRFHIVQPQSDMWSTLEGGALSNLCILICFELLLHISDSFFPNWFQINTCSLLQGQFRSSWNWHNNRNTMPHSLKQKPVSSSLLHFPESMSLISP